MNTSSSRVCVPSNTYNTYSVCRKILIPTSAKKSRKWDNGTRLTPTPIFG